MGGLSERQRKNLKKIEGNGNNERCEKTSVIANYLCCSQFPPGHYLVK